MFSSAGASLLTMRKMRVPHPNLCRLLSAHQSHFLSAKLTDERPALIFTFPARGIAIEIRAARLWGALALSNANQSKGSHRVFQKMTNILSLTLGLGLAMIVHELGHVFAARRCGVPASELGLGVGPRVFAFSIRNFTFSLRAIPVASFVRLDGNALNQCTVMQRSFVHLGGIVFNLLTATIAQGTLFGRINLLLALANLLPIYKHDGWKVGVVLMRALLGRTSQPVEWAFTFSGGFASLVLVVALFRLFV